MPFDLTNELLSALLGTGVGYSLKLGYDQASRILVRDRIVKQMWGFLAEPTHVFLALSNTDGEKAVAGYGDLLALANLITIANRYFPSSRSIKVHPGARDYAPFRNENIVVIGGGKHNAMYRDMVNLLRVPLHFFDTDTESYTEIRNKERSIIYCPEYGADRIVINDTGLAVRARNPNNRKKWIIVVAGSHTYGSAGAMQFLTESASLKDIVPKKNENIEIIIRCHLKDLSIAKVERISPIMFL